jgi:serine/threonine protein kinase
MDILHRADGRRSRISSTSVVDVTKEQQISRLFLTIAERLTLYEEDQLEPLGPLSSGTSFEVTKCRDLKNGRVVAVKKLHRGSNQSADRWRLIPLSIMEEMKISAWLPFLRHPNITQTIGYQKYVTKEGDFVLTLVVEFASLGTLEQYLHCHREQTMDEKHSLSLDIASGLEMLHRYQVVHGDLKPSNILIFAQPRPNTSSPILAKVSDFSNAIAENTVTTIDATRLQKRYYGTALWEPPMVRSYFGELPFYLLPVFDNFSLGLILWTVLKGRCYFEPGWRDEHQTEAECLDELGVEGLVDKFEEFLLLHAQTQSEPVEIALKLVVRACMSPSKWLDVPKENIPKGNKLLLKENFGRSAGLRIMIANRLTEVDV